MRVYVTLLTFVEKMPEYLIFRTYRVNQVSQLSRRGGDYDTDRNSH